MEDFNSKYTGTQVEALLDIVAQGGSSGGGGTITEAEIAAMGFTKNEGTITEVKMNGVSKGTSGVVDLGDVASKDAFDNLVDTVDSINEDVAALYDDKQDTVIDLADIREGAAKGATSVQPNDIEDVARKDNGYVIANGILDEADKYWHMPDSSLNDKEHTLASKSDIPSAVTESTISGWGFTKNTGTYSKPSGGIPKSDLETSVQTSLDKADTAVQTYIVDFDISQLLSGKDIDGVNTQRLSTAIKDRKLILIPYNKSNPLYGYLPMNAYTEDAIYFSVVYDTKIISVEAWDDSPEILASGIWIEDISHKQDKIKFNTGELSFITASGLNAENSDLNVVLPSDANGDEDDVLLTRDSVKTINGESIFGSGNIVISGGGGSGGEVYLTPFTVEQFCAGNVTLTDEQRNELLNAASQNKIIGMPYYIIRNTKEAGCIIANYYYALDDTSASYVWSLRLDVVFEGAHYTNFITSQGNPNNFAATRAVITPFKPLTHTVTVEDGVAIIDDDASFTDNRLFLVDGECTELYIYVEPSEIGKTIRFFTGESCTLEFASTVYWANGEIPTIEPYTHYELSLVMNMEYAYNAVLTPFKLVE